MTPFPSQDELAERLRAIAGGDAPCPMVLSRVPYDAMHKVADWLASEAAALSHAPAIHMILFCPKCGLQHIDAVSDAQTPGWANPPHKSHLCHACAHIWRPADVPTNGVMQIETAGKADTAPAIRNYSAASPPVTDGWRDKAQYWRNDAFEAAAQIVEKYFPEGGAARPCASDIRALKKSLPEAPKP